MPHPHFRTIWEENSYWRHYDNYMESKQLEEEREETLEKQQQLQQQSRAQAQAEAEQPWTLVTRRRRGQNK
jgi:hypothetical protein